MKTVFVGTQRWDLCFVGSVFKKHFFPRKTHWFSTVNCEPTFKKIFFFYKGYSFPKPTYLLRLLNIPYDQNWYRLQLTQTRHLWQSNSTLYSSQLVEFVPLRLCHLQTSTLQMTLHSRGVKIILVLGPHVDRFNWHWFKEVICGSQILFSTKKEYGQLSNLCKGLMLSLVGPHDFCILQHTCLLKLMPRVWLWRSSYFISNEVASCHICIAGLLIVVFLKLFIYLLFSHLFLQVIFLMVCLGE